MKIKRQYLVTYWQSHYEESLDSFPLEALQLPHLDPAFSALIPQDILNTFLTQQQFDAK